MKTWQRIIKGFLLTLFLQQLLQLLGEAKIQFQVLSEDNHGCWNASSLPCATNAFKVIPGMTEQDRKHSRGDLVDYRRKILMSWTAKAGCTLSVLMFLHHMGFKDGVDFKGWVHEFRSSVFYSRCGYMGPCIFRHKEFYKFKVVRNPYDRAVSSYLHVMRSRLINDEKLLHGIHQQQQHPKHQQKHRSDMSFKQFIDYLEAHVVTPLEQAFDAGGHAQKQSYDFEFLEWLSSGKQIYDRIVKLENLEADMALVNSEANASFVTDFHPTHYVPRIDVTTSSTDAVTTTTSTGAATDAEEVATTETTTATITNTTTSTTNADAVGYVGDLSFSQIEHRIPSDYGLFYDAQDQIRVSRIYHADLLLYDYSYPYKNMRCSQSTTVASKAATSVAVSAEVSTGVAAASDNS